MTASWRWLAVMGGCLLAGAAAAADIELEFEADMASEMAQARFDPARDSLGLRGGCAPLSWSQSVPMKALGGTRYGLRLPMAAQACGGQALQHKFRIERAGQGGDEGWEPGRNHAVQINGPGPLRVARVFGAPALPVPGRITGTVVTMDAVATRHVPPRPVWVWLPPGYETEPQRRYPVLVLHDGQNMFDASSSGAEWQLDESAQRLVLGGQVQPFIMVAVPSGRDRVFELTPTAAVLAPERSGLSGARGLPVGGGLPAYARYLVEDLKPAIDARWRTLPGPQHWAVGGSSLGGLASLWLALHHRSTFGAALVVSPSLWWDDGFALRDVQAQPAAGLAPVRLWLSMGGQEGAGALPAARQLRDALVQRGGSTRTLAYTEAPEDRHDEASWARRGPAMLQFLHGVSQALPQAGAGMQDASAPR